MQNNTKNNLNRENNSTTEVIVDFDELQSVVDEILFNGYISDDEVLLTRPIVASSSSVVIKSSKDHSKILLDSANSRPTNTTSVSSPQIHKLMDSLSSTCSSFDKHLKYPDPIKTKRGTILLSEDRPPMSISSAKWKEFHRKQVEVKQKRRTDIDERKTLRLSKKYQKTNNKKKPSGKTKIGTNRCQKLSCGVCEDELDTDAEEDGLKNIGCDKCTKWYHLACTKLCTKTFDEAQNEDFICNFCT